MVIWNWLIAKAFTQYKTIGGVIIFASWVSNSSCKDPLEFAKEKNLLIETLKKFPEHKIVYFSTCSIYDISISDVSLYIQHKLEMEDIISKSWTPFLIARISNPIWKTDNPHTIFNYFFRHIRDKERFNLWLYAKRNFIDVEDIFKAVDFILKNNILNNRIIDIANPKNILVLEIVEMMQNKIGIPAIFNCIEWWWEPKIDLNDILDVFSQSWISFGSDYYSKLFDKYYQ